KDPAENSSLGGMAENLPGLLDNRRWVANVMAAAQALRRQDVPELLRTVYDDISAGAVQQGLSAIALAFRCHPERTLDEIRRQGLFRGSKYRFQTAHVGRVIAALLAQADRLSLAEGVIQYLQSVSNLLRLSSAVRNLDTSLREFVVRRKDQALKTI